MKFSIIVPAYNSERYIEQCLYSLFSQDYPKKEYEVIVADGGSTDRTLEIAREYEAKILHVPNKAISDNKNKASKVAKGRYLLFTDSDCAVDKEYLKFAEALLKKYDCVGGFYLPAKNSSWVARGWLLLERKKAGFVSWVVGGNMAIRKDIFVRVDRFDDSLDTAEDADFCYRLSENGFRIYNSPSLKVFHLGQSDNLIKFFRKEVWRGNCLVKMLKKYGGREMSSFLLTFYHLFMLLFAAVSFFIDKHLVLYSMVLFFTPSFIQAILKSLRVRSLFWLPSLFMLLVFYHAARAMSLIAYSQFKELF